MARRQFWTRERARAAISALARALGRTPRMQDTLGLAPVIPCSATLKRLNGGSFDAAIMDAGLAINQVGPRRRTHCAKGHPLAGENLYYTNRRDRKGLQRECRACKVGEDKPVRQRRVRPIAAHHRVVSVAGRDVRYVQRWSVA